MDDWRATQAGFRADLSVLGSAFTVQGDMYENIIDTPGGRRSGGNRARPLEQALRRRARRSRLQAYYDQQNRSDLAATGGGASDQSKTFDMEAEHAFTLGRNQQIVWGIGQRVLGRSVRQHGESVHARSAEPDAEPDERCLRQDTIALRDDLKLDTRHEVRIQHASAAGP